MLQVLAMKGSDGMVAKKQVKKPTAKMMRDRGTFQHEGETNTISAGVWGQLAPLDKVMRDKQSKWGDSLTELVSPDLAGRFSGAYEALNSAVEENDIVKVNKLVGALMRAWDVLESEAEAAGHKPLPDDAFCVELEQGKFVCIAMTNIADLRMRYPNWVVYSFEDAARVISASFTDAFLQKAFEAFPKATVTRVGLNDDLDDEIPF